MRHTDTEPGRNTEQGCKTETAGPAWPCVGKGQFLDLLSSSRRSRRRNATAGTGRPARRRALSRQRRGFRFVAVTRRAMALGPAVWGPARMLCVAKGGPLGGSACSVGRLCGGMLFRLSLRTLSWLPTAYSIGSWKVSYLRDQREKTTLRRRCLTRAAPSPPPALKLSSYEGTTTKCLWCWWLGQLGGGGVI